VRPRRTETIKTKQEEQNNSDQAGKAKQPKPSRKTKSTETKQEEQINSDQEGGAN
jgi:hypothetical protein